MQEALDFVRERQAAQAVRPRLPDPPVPRIETNETILHAGSLNLGPELERRPTPPQDQSLGNSISANFEVIPSIVSGVAVWGVVFGSTVSDNPRSPTSGSAVTGTLSSATPTNSDPGWFTIQASDAIWLKVTFGTWPAVSSYSIETLAASTFDGGTSEYVTDGMTPPTYTQTYARAVLAVATQSGGVLATFNQKALGSPVMKFSVEPAALSGGGTVENVLCLMPFF